MISPIKTILPLLSLLAVPSALLASDKADGLLGVDYVSASYTYYHDDMGYYHVSDSCAYGLSLTANKSVWSNARFGVDARARYFYVSNLSGSKVYELDQHNGELGAVLYMQGRIRPFVGFSTIFRHTTEKDVAADKDYTDNLWQLDGRVGVEFLLMPGLSANVAVSETHNCKDVYPENYTHYSAGVAYWVNDRLGFTVSEVYTPHQHVDSYGTTLALLYRF